MNYVKLVIFGGLLSLTACSGHNPQFDCAGLGCSEKSVVQSQSIQTSLSFLKTLEQGYWYSRYNLGNLVFKSGNGETFMPNADMVGKMVAMVSDDLSQATVPKNPALLKRVYNSGNPSFKYQGNDNPMDFKQFRWSEICDSEKTTGQSFGWTLMKEVEWSKLFNVDTDFGIPKKNDVPAAQQRFSGLVLCVESIMQADTFIKDFNDKGDDFDLSTASDQYVTFMAMANLAQYLKTPSIPGIMKENRCGKVAEMMKAKSASEVATDYQNFLSDFESDLQSPQTIKEKSLFVQAYAYYAELMSDKKIYSAATKDILEELKNDDYSQKSLTETAYALRALIDGNRILGEKSYLEKSHELWNKIKDDFSLETNTFKSQQTFSTEDVAIIFSALNALKLFGGEDLKYYDVIKVFINSFDSLINQSQLQISAPPVESISQWERKTKKLHRAANLPFPRTAGAEFGRAPVFASSITFDKNSNSWSSTLDKFDSSGAMNLANQMVWFHDSEVSGFPCPDDNCAKARALSNSDLVPPKTATNGNGSSNGSVTAGPVITFDKIYSDILTRCIACHSGAGASVGLNMANADTAYANLVGVPAVEGSAVGVANRVTPGDPSASYLIGKLQESGDNRIANRMPMGGPYLSDAEIGQIKAWIKAGAKR